jgi:uncharacterized membrane protein YccC
MPNKSNDDRAENMGKTRERESEKQKETETEKEWQESKTGEGGGGGGGAELELPQDLLSVLPSDPYEQLDVARRITAMAVTARVAKLESETGKLRLKLAEKEHVIHDLQERVGDAESSLQETTARLSHALDEQAKLANEKDMLAGQVKKLMRDVAKLETFKRTLMQSLQEDDENPAGAGGEKRGAANSNLAIRRASRKLLHHQSRFSNRVYLITLRNPIMCPASMT